jgi:hypothetical protein
MITKAKCPGAVGAARGVVHQEEPLMNAVHPTPLRGDRDRYIAHLLRNAVDIADYLARQDDVPREVVDATQEAACACLDHLDALGLLPDFEEGTECDCANRAVI